MALSRYDNYRYHGYPDRYYTSHGIYWVFTHPGRKYKTRRTVVQERKLTYRFYTHFHPYVRQLIKELIEKSVPGLQATDTDYTDQTLANGQLRPRLYDEFFRRYNPNDELIPPTVEGSDRLLHPVKDLDFTSSGAYSVYNWELFFHIPLTLAMHLSKNQRYEEAMRWFHYIFDPTDDSDGPTPQRFWKVKPFQQTDVQLIENVLTNLSTGTDPELLRDTVNSIDAWKNDPFRPHVIARYRQTAYMFKTIMAYLDNLIDWGDSLFLQDTGESINEATQLYVLAANILGPRPQAVPKKGRVKAQSYSQIREDLDAFGNALRELEVDIPFDIAPIPSSASNDDQVISLRNMGATLYFCIPRNNKLLGYWDTVADRLYKIHNSLNLQGVFRQLPLFEPPIDPAMLARAAAAGLNIGSVISGLNQPLPLVRFRSMVQRAYEICQEVKSLGSNLLGTIEKQDGEALSMLRAKHDTHIQELIEEVRYAQWQESIKNKEGIEKNLAATIARFTHYETLLGNTAIQVPNLDGLDTAALTKLKFKSDEPEVAPREVGYDAFAEALDAAGLGDVNALRLNTGEALAMLFEASTIPIEIAAIILDAIGGALTIIPEIGAEVTPLGVGAGVRLSGEQLGQIMQLMSSASRGGESILRTLSSLSSSIGSYARRKQDWEMQSQQAALEINGIYKQLVAAQIREHIAKKEYNNHIAQIENTKEIEDFLKGEKMKKLKGYTKTTTQGFYAFLRREVKGLHNKYFQFAFDTAKKAERALQHELGNMELSYLQFNYLAGQEGLYAGEKLGLDIKRMEMAYLDMNARELELTKHISLMQLNPMALFQLRMTGSCKVSIPEEIFDMGGCEGHYFRRIRSVGISIPCVAGPYTSINCTLTLTKSSIRKKSNLLNDEYVRQDDDDRFSDHYGSTSIVTSVAQNDNGMFESSPGDERYLPFEYKGAVSEWQLELANEFRQFDYQTITDVIFHFQYTARQAGGLLKKGAIANLKTMIEVEGNTRMLSLKHQFASHWHQFTTSTPDGEGRHLLTFQLLESHYPYWGTGLVNEIRQIQFYALAEAPVVMINPNDTEETFELVRDERLGDMVYAGSWENFELPVPLGEVSLLVDTNAIKDMWVFIEWVKSV
ncbi:MAG: insecticidal toxin protein [Bacteroidota bacterium]